MLEVYKNLWCGNQANYEFCNFKENEWSFVLAAKEPWHRREIGYEGRGCPKDDPDYLFARRNNRLILNLVDAPKPEFFDKSLIDTALVFIDEQLNLGKNVLVCCNQGESRSPSICLLYMASKGFFGNGMAFEKAEEVFKHIYPPYNPGPGIREFMRLHWGEYVG